MKVSIIGVGRVGATLAFAASLKGFVRELVLVGRSEQAARGDALDLRHAQSFVDVPTRVRSGGVAETAGSDIIAVCASAPPPEDFAKRSDLGVVNTRLLRELLPPLAGASPDAIIVVISNPVDVLTYFATEFSGFPPERVIGSGTLIDSARLRHVLSEEIQIHSDDLRAYILGEHGPTQFAAMSVATAGGEPIDLTPRRREMIREVVDVGIEIFRCKGYTNFGVALAGVTIIEAIGRDMKHTMPVSVRADGFLGEDDVCLSLPAVVGAGGIERILHPRLSAAEARQFRTSARVIREQIEHCRRALEQA